ncbi:MAG TPA: ATP-binding protein, partial [Cryptosporangiaceae bacterium]|nr:ATP-binding protein [Cryptosporangiaceae bacterium]
LRAVDVEALLDVLLDNVFSHTPERTPYWIFLTDGSLVVEDAGPGLTRDVVERGQSRVGSTGLGLDIARQLARRAGGELRVEARQPSGARVVVEFAP